MLDIWTLRPDWRSVFVSTKLAGAFTHFAVLKTMTGAWLPCIIIFASPTDSFSKDPTLTGDQATISSHIKQILFLFEHHLVLNSTMIPQKVAIMIHRLDMAYISNGEHDIMSLLNRPLNKNIFMLYATHIPCPLMHSSSCSYMYVVFKHLKHELSASAGNCELSD